MKRLRVWPKLNFTRRHVVSGICVVAMVMAFSCLAFGAAPIANYDSVTIDEDTSVVIDVLANDSDADGDLLTIASVTTSEYGTASIEYGKIRYTPAPNTYGMDYFSYTVTDGTDTDTAMVTVNVFEVPDTAVTVDELLTTEYESAVSFNLQASDPDVIPTFPKLHILKFEIIKGPEHGTLSGDLTAVIYESPNKASVEMTYTPDEGFTGSDTITFLVTDPFGLDDTGNVKIIVGKRAEGVVSGSWDTSITTQGQPFEISALSSTLVTRYTLGDFGIRVDSSWRDDVFSSLSLKTSFPLGEALTVRSTLAFDPDDSPFFNYWRTTTSFSFSDIRFTHTFYLPENSDSTYSQLIARTTIENVSLTSTTKLTGLDLSFDKQEFSARLRWTECDYSVSGKLAIESEGFDEFSLTVRDIPVLGTTDDDYRVTLRIETTFATASQTIEATLTCRSSWNGDLRILWDIETSGDSDTLIDSISLYGLKFRSKSLAGISGDLSMSFVDSKNSSVTGYSDYFVKWMLSGSTAYGRWQVGNYLQSSESNPFGWGMTTFKLDATLVDQLDISTKITYRSEDPHWEWTSGWDVSW